ncbi:hypothetical protein HYH03_004605 [Edaphochlamys debaryana]|uniref:FAD-binding FR-type domain-containing protein n=1 Tax=Edaphochlamys debaryana TaxID=47281 RepID=A0A835YES0_9CHLO|nr:hypothetical protein HYH03_004605 [Edaphochlamys debaryana]|eukprot:KAG2497450.1 hypothetical protein HYH03_004605 [Edaphochlamys debaryana]
MALTANGLPSPALRTSLAAFFWLLVLAGGATFSFFLCVTPTRWMIVQNKELIAWRSTLILTGDSVLPNVTVGRATPLLSSTVSWLLIWQWATTLAAAMGAVGLWWVWSLPALAPKTSAADAKPSGFVAGASRLARKAAHRTKRVLQWRVPPRGLWQTLLGPGGLSVLDLILILFWIGIHILWLHEMTMRVVDNRRANPPPPSPKKSTSPALAPTASGSAPSPFPTGATGDATNATARGLAEEAFVVRRRLLADPTAPATAPASSSPAVSAPSSYSTSPASTKPASSSSAPTNATRTPTPPPPARRLQPLPRVVQVSVFKYTGWVGRLDILLLFFPLPRCNFLGWLLGAAFPELIKYHRWLGHGTIIVFSIHSIGYMGLWAAEGTLKKELDWGMTGGVNNVAGLVSMCGGWLLWVTCLPYVRRKLFNLFYACHCLGAVIFMLFGFMHRKDVATWVMPGVILYLLDVTLRTLQQWFNSTAATVQLEAGPTAAAAALTAATQASVSPNGEMLSLSISCDQALTWTGSDIVFLNVPAVSWLQWHPFTIASPCTAVGEGGRRLLQLHIKSYDRWTKRLVARLASDPAPLKLHVSGPYPGPSHSALEPTARHVLIAGGIGVTPVLGMLRDLIAARRSAAAASNGNGPMSPVSFIWVSRSADELSLLPEDVAQEASRGKGGWLDVRLFLTGGSAQSKADGTTSGKALAASPSAIRLRVDALRARCAAPCSAADGPAAARPLLHPYVTGPLMWACCAVLSFVGAFGGLLAAQGYDASMARTTKTRNDYSYIGMLQFVFLGLGAVLPPAALMLAWHTSIRLRSRRSSGAASRDSSSSSPSPTAAVMISADAIAGPGSVSSSGSPADSAYPCADSVLPHAKVSRSSEDSSTGASPVPSSLATFLTPGRPDLAALLEGAAADAEGADEESAARVVHVFVAGPAALVGRVEQLCAERNGAAWAAGRRAYLECTPLTHEL